MTVGKYDIAKYKRLYSERLSQEWKKERKCLFCDNKFIPNRSNQFYCNDSCKSNAQFIRYKKNYIKKTLEIKKVCIICNKEFLTNRKQALTCNIICRKEYCKQQSLKYHRVTGHLALRFKILKRDNFTCQYCGRKPIQDNTKLMVDHIIPKSKGGTDEESNLKTSCEACNLGKYDVLL